MTRKKMKLVKQSEMTYAELFEEFIRYQKIVELAEETINAYIYNYKYRGRFIDVENELVKDLGPTTLINDFIQHHIKRTISKAITHIYDTLYLYLSVQ